MRFVALLLTFAGAMRWVSARLTPPPKLTSYPNRLTRDQWTAEAWRHRN